MPRGLDELYRQTLERIQTQDGDDGALGMRIISWITHARRPLSVDELRYGLAVEYNDNDDDNNEGNLEEFNEDNLLSPRSLVDVCAGLVIIDSTSQIIRLVHYTTQEYFDKARLHLFRGVEIDLSRACLTYLSYKTSTESMTIPLAFDEAHKSHPFLDYAARHWISHVRSGLLSESPGPIFSKAVARWKSSDNILSWTELLLNLSHDHHSYDYYRSHFDRDRNPRTFPLEIASYLGIEELVDVLLDHSTGSCPGPDTSLIFASSKGHMNVVKLLLLHGARVDSTMEESSVKFTALGEACIMGNLSVMKILIENGAKIYDQSTDRPLLHLAATLCHSDMVYFLVEEGANINGRDSDGRTPCHAAARSGRVDTVKYLLDAHCDLELTDNDGQSVLHHAARLSRLDTIQLLLYRGADASAKNNKGETARNLLEQHLPDLVSKGIVRDLEKPQQVIQKLLQLEQMSAASATNSP